MSAVARRIERTRRAGTLLGRTSRTSTTRSCPERMQQTSIKPARTDAAWTTSSAVFASEPTEPEPSAEGLSRCPRDSYWARGKGNAGVVERDRGDPEGLRALHEISFGTGENHVGYGHSRDYELEQQRSAPLTCAVWLTTMTLTVGSPPREPRTSRRHDPTRTTLLAPIRRVPSSSHARDQARA